MEFYVQLYKHINMAYIMLNIRSIVCHISIVPLVHSLLYLMLLRKLIGINKLICKVDLVLVNRLSSFCSFFKVDKF